MAEKKSIYRSVDGVSIPAFFEPAVERPLEEHVQLVKVMDMRPDDVIIGAFAKAGTHWIWEVLRMIINGRAQYEKKIKEFSMLEATPIEELRNLPSPRLLNSHLPPRVLPKQIKEKVKVIHLYRNCKDVLVSAYFHFRQVQDVSVDDVASTIIGPGVPGGDYFSYMKEMDDFRKDNPDIPFLAISFEDIKEDPEKMMKKMAEFLGVEASPQLIREIIEATSINKLREANKTKQQNEKLPVSEFYRKGQVGDWKNTLTVAQSERLDAAMKQLESCDYNFRYSL